MTSHTSVPRGAWGSVLLSALLLLGACAEIPDKQEAKKDDRQLVFPAPPDEPRFVYERTLYSSADVADLDAGDRNASLRRMLTGESEKAGVSVGKPYGVAARRGKIFVADSTGSSVKVYDIQKRKFSVIGSENPGLQQPLGLDTDKAGNLYVVDASARSVKMYDPDGKFVRAFGGTKALTRPTGVAVDPAGERVYVVDTGGVDKQEEHRVRVYDAKTGDHLFDFGKRGTGPGEFNLARDAVYSPVNNRLYVVDTGNFRVQVFDRDGKFVKTFGQIGRAAGQFSRPREAAVDSEGNVYVSDAAFGNLQIFSPEGEVLMFIGSRTDSVDEPGKYILPAGIAVDEDGRIYMADQFFRKVEVYRPYKLKEEEGYGWPPQEKPAAKGAEGAAKEDAAKK